jgi:hypothetical protein
MEDARALFHWALFKHVRASIDALVHAARESRDDFLLTLRKRGRYKIPSKRAAASRVRPPFASQNAYPALRQTRGNHS